MFTINCKGKPVHFVKPAVMGIINATPDSFYEGSRRTGIDAIVEQATAMLTNGADIIDIGGQSTRPGSEPIDGEVELSRVIPAIEAIARRFPDALISIDTYHAGVAAAAVNAGASIVNDISGGDLDADMISTVAALRVPFIVMHMKGNPQTMSSLAQYENVTAEVLDQLAYKVRTCRQAGIKDIIIDPGFGFAKTAEHSFRLLHELHALKLTGCPLLAGLSRKSLIYRTLGISADESLTGTIALNMLALNNGTDILRVHDVKEAVQTVTLFEAYKKAAS